MPSGFTPGNSSTTHSSESLEMREELKFQSRLQETQEISTDGCTKPGNMKEDSDDSFGGPIVEEEGLLGRRKSSSVDKGAWTMTTKLLVVSNVCLILILIISWVFASKIKCKCTEDLKPPYSPLYEDGAVKYVNKMFTPEKTFQSEPSDEVDAAWNATMGSSEGVVQLPKDIASRLPESIELFFEPGYYAYGVSAHHQLHCLNRIRKSFYAEKYFPNETKEEILFHKNHCIDLLRQAIMCNGDVSLVYWWNSNYSYLDSNGVKHYTQEYLSRNNSERAKSSFVKWEVAARCHDWDSINEWAEKHKFSRESYLEFLKQMEQAPKDAS